ncbi:tRNA (guanine10-N2)-dimethyltransferase [Halogranum rubrum]|uniref:tRNA (guanine(10)-N(2))-dimethyltransferase n=1 Tax=Halogranum rubrum TaxID=553466 RepID=A0A1I4GDG6_9EURY|nr:methyltransferase domain-containing protein [Halogranum rubrum]SFL28102.1 tRNA (guanine10-N2)-dimethyltransferase [Halogranum rubrum]
MYCLELAGEDDAFAACEAESAADAVDVVASGLATARGISPDRLRMLAYTHRASELVGHTDADVESARHLLEAASIERSGTVAVRARDVHSATDVSTQDAERTLGSVLVDRGFSVDLDDPDHVLRVLFSDDVCILGWLDVESIRDFGDRKPTDRPFFQPGSMAPLDARAFVNIAGAGPGKTVLDPMCGTGGVLLEAALVGARVVGADAQWKMARGSRTNLAELTPEATWDVVRGDATSLALQDDSVDGVVFDAPYGRQSKIARHDLKDLVAGALSEAARVAPRAVVVADRSWADAAVDAGWDVERLFQRRVHRSLTRYVHVLTRA